MEQSEFHPRVLFLLYRVLGRDKGKHFPHAIHSQKFPREKGDVVRLLNGAIKIMGICNNK